MLAHLAVRAIRGGTERLLVPVRLPGITRHQSAARRYPKVATVTSLVVSALTFTIYFVALGLVLREFQISLTAYLATASVLGLAVGFGSQGLVQDVVIGLTLIFSDALDVGDMVEISGQIGRVDHVGLRFTVLVNVHGQRVYVPNRNIALVGRYRGGCIRAYLDAQVPEGADEAVIRQIVERTALPRRGGGAGPALTGEQEFEVHQPPLVERVVAPRGAPHAPEQRLDASEVIVGGVEPLLRRPAEGGH